MTDLLEQDLFVNNIPARRRHSTMFRHACGMVTWIGVVLLAVMLYHVFVEGYAWVDAQFLTSFPSRFPARAGIKSALWGSVWTISFIAIIAVPIGVASAIYLEEYAKPTRFNRFIELNIANLAGVPSIVFGMLGLMIFVRTFGLGRTILAGSLTMSLLVMPVIIIAAREAIRAVPPSLRHAAYALGATPWQTIRGHVLPAALPGILTGVILALSRAIGETAPLIIMGALTYVAFTPTSPLDEFTTLPIQIFNWASRPQQEFHEIAAAAILVLLTVLLLMNAVAVIIRQRSHASS